MNQHTKDLLSFISTGQGLPFLGSLDYEDPILKDAGATREVVAACLKEYMAHVDYPSIVEMLEEEGVLTEAQIPARIAAEKDPFDLLDFAKPHIQAQWTEPFNEKNWAMFIAKHQNSLLHGALGEAVHGKIIEKLRNEAVADAGEGVNFFDWAQSKQMSPLELYAMSNVICGKGRPSHPNPRMRGNVTINDALRLGSEYGELGGMQLIAVPREQITLYGNYDSYMRDHFGAQFAAYDAAMSKVALPAGKSADDYVAIFAHKYQIEKAIEPYVKDGSLPGIVTFLNTSDETRKAMSVDGQPEISMRTLMPYGADGKPCLTQPFIKASLNIFSTSSLRNLKSAEVTDAVAVSGWMKELQRQNPFDADIHLLYEQVGATMKDLPKNVPSGLISFLARDGIGSLCKPGEMMVIPASLTEPSPTNPQHSLLKEMMLKAGCNDAASAKQYLKQITAIYYKAQVACASVAQTHAFHEQNARLIFDAKGFPARVIAGDLSNPAIDEDHMNDLGCQLADFGAETAANLKSKGRMQQDRGNLWTTDGTSVRNLHILPRAQLVSKEWGIPLEECYEAVAEAVSETLVDVYEKRGVSQARLVQDLKHVLTEPIQTYYSLVGGTLDFSYDTGEFPSENPLAFTQVTKNFFPGYAPSAQEAVKTIGQDHMSLKYTNPLRALVTA